MVDPVGQILSAIEFHFPERAVAAEAFNSAVERFVCSGLAVTELLSRISNEEHFLSAYWEFLVGNHLLNLGYTPTKKNSGPDFRFEIGGRVAWVECYMPEPHQLPDEWVNHQPGSYWVPSEAIKARWAYGVFSKYQQLQRYLEGGVVSEDDAYVIAINGNRLGPFATDEGLSRFPALAECVYPFGKLAVEINTLTGDHRAVRTVEPELQIASKNPIATDIFFRKDTVGISGLLGSSQLLPSQLARGSYWIPNFNARVPISNGWFGEIPYLVAEKTDQTWQFRMSNW